MLKEKIAVPERKVTTSEPVVEGRLLITRSSSIRVQATMLRSALRLDILIIMMELHYAGEK